MKSALKAAKRYHSLSGQAKTTRLYAPPTTHLKLGTQPKVAKH